MQQRFFHLLGLHLLLIASTVVAAQFTQAPLGYAYTALEPVIDAKTMEIHYTKHHAAYVANLNKAIADAKIDTSLSLDALMAQISKYPVAVRNNGGGHYNHTLYWEILTPSQNSAPSQKLLAAIEKDFGSLEELKKTIFAAGIGQFGSGWAWLVVTADDKLVVSNTANQDNPLMDIATVKGMPLIGLDVWEHAYYLTYQNKRAAYLEALWGSINWRVVSDKYEKALKK